MVAGARCALVPCPFAGGAYWAVAPGLPAAGFRLLLAGAVALARLGCLPFPGRGFSCAWALAVFALVASLLLALGAPPSPPLLARFALFPRARPGYSVRRVAFSPATFPVPCSFRFFSFLFLLLLACSPGWLLLPGSGTASWVCARSRVAGRASIWRPALPWDLPLLVLHAVPPSPLPLPLPSLPPLAPEFLYLPLELAPGLFGLGMVGLALMRPGHPTFGTCGGYVHAEVGFSKGVAPAFCAVVTRRAGGRLVPRPRLSLLPLAPVVHLHNFRACAVVAWIELRSLRICVLGCAAGFLRRLTPFRPFGLHVCSACLHGRFCTGPLCRERGPLFSAFGPSCVQRARVFVQGLCIVARATAPLCVGFPRCGGRACGRWMRGRGGFLFGLGAPRGVGPLFSASGVGAGVFGCGLVLLPSLALFVGLHLDFGLCCAWSGKKKVSF